MSQNSRQPRRPALFAGNRLFIAMGVVVLLFALSFAFPVLFLPAKVVLALIIGVVIIELGLLYQSKPMFSVERTTSRLLSLGDENRIEIRITNNSGRNWRLSLIDEIPFQFQVRDFQEDFSLGDRKTKKLEYELRPISRGEYHFGKIHLFLKTPLQIFERRVSIDAQTMVPVYPSVLQMKGMELMALARVSHDGGIKKIRRIGHSYEFEQIKNYVQGDDIRSINWKATSRRNQLMVNQYEDERSQQVYCVIDTGRSMRMPFEGMSLLDYAINTSLVMSNVSLAKYDKAGMVSFDKQIRTAIPAERRRSQLNQILESLYRQEETQFEADFELLYRGISKLSPARSLLILFSNFESQFALDRALPVLRKIAKRHLLLLVLFENAEIVAASQEEPQDLEGIYRRTIAGEFLHEKREMALRATRFGIQTIITRPEDLSVNTVNKYLELKARGMI